MGWFIEREGSASGPLSEDDARSLLRAEDGGADVLVWREGLSDWEPAGRQAEFAIMFLQRPPPLPKRLSAAGLQQSPPSLPARPAAPDGVPVPTTAVPAATPRTSDSPWSRYFGRQIDLMYLGGGSMFIIGWTLARFSPAASKSFTQLDERFLGILAIAAAVVLNAGIVNVFGNSLGKAIFGLRAVPADSTRLSSPFWAFGREMRVWFYGLAAGIPIVALFTMIRNYKEVKAGRPARYDRDRAEVVETPIGGLRRALGIVLAVAMMAALVALGVWSAEADRYAASAKPWTNPVTREVVMLPGGWVFDPDNSEPSEQLFAFSSSDGTVAAFLAAESLDADLSAKMDTSDYAELLSRSLADTVEFSGRWTPMAFASKRAMMRPAMLKSEGWPAAFAVWKQGTTFWRVMMLDSASASTPRITDSEIVDALVSSVPR